MASLDVWEYQNDTDVIFPLGDLLIEDGDVRVRHIGSREYKNPTKEQAAEIAAKLREWAEMTEKSVKDDERT